MLAEMFLATNPDRFLAVFVEKLQSLSYTQAKFFI